MENQPKNSQKILRNTFRRADSKNLTEQDFRKIRFEDMPFFNMIKIENSENLKIENSKSENTKIEKWNL